MWHWNDEIMARERQAAWLHAVEQHRLIRLAEASQPRPTPRSGRMLRWLGQHLIGWGEALQQRAACQDMAIARR